MTLKIHGLKITIWEAHLGCLAYFDDLNVTEPKAITLEEFLWQGLFYTTKAIAAVLFDLLHSDLPMYMVIKYCRGP